MPRPALRSRSLRRLIRKTPGGKSKNVYKRRKPSNTSCSSCGNKLSGVPRDRVANVRKLSMTKRKPKRMFGGKLCSKCSRKTIKNRLLSKWAIEA